MFQHVAPMARPLLCDWALPYCLPISSSFVLYSRKAFILSFSNSLCLHGDCHRGFLFSAFFFPLRVESNSCKERFMPRICKASRALLCGFLPSCDVGFSPIQQEGECCIIDLTEEWLTNMDDKGLQNHKLWHEIFASSSQAFTWSISWSHQIPKLFKGLETKMSGNISSFLLFAQSTNLESISSLVENIGK